VVVARRLDEELVADGRLDVLLLLAVLGGAVEGVSSAAVPLPLLPPPPAAAAARCSRYGRPVPPPGSSPSPLSSPTHRSQSSQPRKVAKLPHPTTDTGLTRSWKMPTKHTTKMMTEQTCCTMTVESATSGQKSYGCRRGLRWRLSRKVAWSV